MVNASMKGQSSGVCNVSNVQQVGGKSSMAPVALGAYGGGLKKLLEDTSRNECDTTDRYDNSCGFCSLALQTGDSPKKIHKMTEVQHPSIYELYVTVLRAAEHYKVPLVLIKYKENKSKENQIIDATVYMPSGRILTFGEESNLNGNFACALYADIKPDYRQLPIVEARETILDVAEVIGFDEKIIWDATVGEVLVAILSKRSTLCLLQYGNRIRAGKSLLREVDDKVSSNSLVNRSVTTVTSANNVKGDAGPVNDSDEKKEKAKGAQNTESLSNR